jgi:hypothetical protein
MYSVEFSANLRGLAGGSAARPFKNSLANGAKFYFDFKSYFWFAQRN